MNATALKIAPERQAQLDEPAEQYAVLYRSKEYLSWSGYEWHEFCSTLAPCEDDAKAHATTYHIGAGFANTLRPGIFKLTLVEEWG